MAKTRNDPARKNRRREEAKQRAEEMRKVGYCRVCLTKHNLLRSCPKPSYWEEPEPFKRRRVGEAVFPDDAGPFVCGDCGEPHFAWHTVTHEVSGVQYAVAFCTKG